MVKQRFPTWLKQQDKRDDPVGDLARDAKRNSLIFNCGSNETKWLHYLSRRTNHTPVFDALHEAFKEWRTANAMIVAKDTVQ